MSILILIDVKFSKEADFSFEKSSNRQNHSFSGSLHPVKKFPHSKISDSNPLPEGFSHPPRTAIWKTLNIYICCSLVNIKS